MYVYYCRTFLNFATVFVKWILPSTDEILTLQIGLIGFSVAYYVICLCTICKKMEIEMPYAMSECYKVDVWKSRWIKKNLKRD